MRIRWLLCGLLWSVAACPAARAGLYLASKPTTWPVSWPPPNNPDPYLQELGELQSLVSDVKLVRERPFPTEVRKQITALEGRRRASPLSVEESITLGGYYLLQRNPNKAIEVLTPALANEPKNFMVLANLANAYEGINESRRAIEFQKQVLSNWPARYAAWNAEQLWWYRRAEKYTLTLLELRNRERLTNAPQTTLDELFPAAPYARRQIKYLVGAIDLKARDRMPPDALPLVEQLLLWMPHDQRLRWQFGELLNARGEVKLAWTEFDQLSQAGFTSELFKEHRSALRDAGVPTVRAQATTPQTSELPPNLGGLEGAADSTQKPWLPDWRQLGVGFGSGLVVGMLLLLQFRQLTRRFARTRPTPSAK